MTDMLELRPICEHCAIELPAAATNAMICSFECTFCHDCVEGVLLDVCPNCGGGFSPRPVRPRTAWKGTNHLGAHLATTTRLHRPVDPEAHRRFAEPIAALAPYER
jgi:uncharacterized protein